MASKPAVQITKDSIDEAMQASPQFSDFNNEQREYARLMWAELVRMRDERQQTHDGFDGLTLERYVELNAKRSNTYIPPRKNVSDDRLTAGLAREKLLAIASHLNRLNLEPEVHSYNKDNDEDVIIGRSLTHAIRKSRKMENDQEKKLARIFTLLEQGTVFIEEGWRPSTFTKKKIKNKKKLDPAKGFEGLDWIEETKTLYSAESQLIGMENVFLGNAYEAEASKQTKLFTVEIKSFEEAKSIFQKWANWKYVKPGLATGLNETSETLRYRDYTLNNIKNDEVEIIKYQDWLCDEYQIIVNGVYMLPFGFPQPWEWDGGSIAWQIYELISPRFAYGKSLMSKVGIEDDLLTEQLRMMMRKTKQSYNPPVANTNSRRLPPRIFDAGVIWNGIDANKIKRLIDHQGVTGSEVQMFSIIKDFIDAKSISRLAQGQQPSRQATATEILELQRQAQINIGLSLFSVMLLEKKISELRMNNILVNWTKPIDQEFDETRQRLVNKHKTIVIDNANVGDKEVTEKIKFTDEDIDFVKAREMSKKMFEEERAGGEKVKTVVISTPILSRLKYSHQVTIVPTQEENDNLNKILLTEEFTQAANMFGLEALNADFYKRKHARVWGNNVEEAFAQLGEQAKERVLEEKMMGGEVAKRGGNKGTAGVRRGMAERPEKEMAEVGIEEMVRR